MERLTFPVRVLAEFGVRALLLTNAAGAVNRSFRPGDFMVLEDHINFMGVNPLRGPALPGLPRFVDLTRVYDRWLIELAKQAAKASRLRLRTGAFIWRCPAPITKRRRKSGRSGVWGPMRWA